MRMKTVLVFATLAAAGLTGGVNAQEEKPVPKDSVRVFVPGCSKDLVFTAGPRTEDQPGRSDIPEGMHLRMHGPKKVIAEIKAHEGTPIEITGLIRKGQYLPGGVNLGGGVRIGPGPSPNSGGLVRDPGVDQTVIDVEGWRPAVGSCASR
jgi:hypothetical protein